MSVISSPKHSNNFLYNEGTELNQTSGWYETMFRGYDATLGRFLQVDATAVMYESFSPYTYAANNPVLLNDPLGLEPRRSYDNPGFSDDVWKLVEDALQTSDAGGGNFFTYQNGIRNDYWTIFVPDPQGGGEGLFVDYTTNAQGNVTAQVRVAGSNGGYMYAMMFVREVVYSANKDAQQGNSQISQAGVGLVFQAGFGLGEGLGSIELALAALKPTFDRAAHFARSQGKVGQVPLYLIKNVFKSPLLANNKSLYLGRTNSSTALGTANTLSKLVPSLTVAGVLTNGYDIVKDGQLTVGDGFQAVNTGLMIAFPVYGVIYGVVDLGFSVFSDQSLTDRIKSGIDSNVSGSYAIPKF